MMTPQHNNCPLCNEERPAITYPVRKQKSVIGALLRLLNPGIRKPLLFIFFHFVLFSANAQWTNQYPEIHLQPFNYADPRFEIFEIDNKTLIISQNSGFLIDENGRLKFAKSLNNNSPFNNHSYTVCNGFLFQGIKFSTGMRIRKHNSNFDVVDSVFVQSSTIVSDGFAIADSLVFVVLYEKFKHTSFREQFILVGYNMSNDIKYRKIINTSVSEPDEVHVEIEVVDNDHLALQFKEKNKVWASLVSLLQLVDFNSNSGMHPDYPDYRFFNEPLYDGDFVFVGDTAFLTARSRYSTGLSIIDSSGNHINTHIFSHIGDIWTNDIDFNDGIIGTLSTSNDHIVFRCLDRSGVMINEEVIDHQCSRRHSDFGHYATFVGNDIGGFTFGYSVIDFTTNEFRPLVFKTDSTCQIQKLQTFDPVVVRKKIAHREIAIFPNPSSGEFNVSGDFELIQVFDSIGRLIKQSRNRRIDLRNHPDGMYFFRVGESTYKVMKQ